MATTSIFRGDSDEWTLTVPLTLWSAGGTFFFALKTKADVPPVDLSDSSAYLTKEYDDTFITSTTATDKVYTLTLDPVDTRGKASGKFIAEFQWVSSGGDVVKTFEQFKYEVKADVNQRVS